MQRPLTRVALFGDGYGIPELLAHLTPVTVAAIVAASVRPASHEPLRLAAAHAGVPLLIQPHHNDVQAYSDFLDQLRARTPDGMLCHSYSMLLRPDMLAMVDNHAFNLHAALLPKNRGPNPVQWALIHGDSHAGITLHRMDEGFDTGPVIAQAQIEIAEEDTWVTLLERVKHATPPLLSRVLDSLVAGTWEAQPQDMQLARINPRIPSEGMPIDFARMDDRTIFNLIRAQVSPLKGAYIDTASGRLHIDTYTAMSDIAALRSIHG